MFYIPLVHTWYEWVVAAAATSDTAAVNVCLAMVNINLSKVIICCKTEVNTAGC